MDIIHRSNKDLSEQDIRDFVSLNNIIRKEERPNDPPQPAEEVIAQLAILPDFVELHSYGIHNGTELIAEGSIQILHLEDNKHLAQINITVHPDHRRQGHGKKILHKVAQHAQQLERRLMMTSSNDRTPAGKSFLEPYGFTAGLENHINQAIVAELDITQLKNWVSDAATRAADYELFTLHGAFPPEQLEEIVALMDVMNTAPKGDLDIEDQHLTVEMAQQMDQLMHARKATRAATFARHKPSGQLVGYSELQWSTVRLEIIAQQDTGVHPDHRNHGLGRALKAANALAMLEQNPNAKFIRTGNADENAPMLKINHAMGFKPYYAVTAWQGATDEVLERSKG